MKQKTTLVITSINSPNEVLKTFSRECSLNDVGYIVVGDVKSPADFSLPNCDFWSIERQNSLPYEIVPILPVKHYGRKNIGYLVAAANKSEVIIETDDDNFPYPEFWLQRSLMQNALRVDQKGWYNAFKCFTDKHIWPRGFALEALEKYKHEKPTIYEKAESPIQQGLADDNPDVDAVYRLTQPLPLKFDKGEPVRLGKNTWCSFNSQNTTWFKIAFPLLYLPSYCSFRMTDIWRSYVAQRIGWQYNWHLLYHESTVYQERNEHDLLIDFKDEISGYLNNGKIVKTLEKLDLSFDKKEIGNNLLKCYEALVKLQLVDEKELDLVKAWNTDMLNILN